MIKAFGVHTDTLLGYFPEIEAELNKTVPQLSGGMERLISVLLIVLANTTFSLLDEPFSHIMPIYVEKLKGIIHLQKINKGIIITDHMYVHLLDISDQIYLMKEGKSIFITDKGQLSFMGICQDDD